MGLRIRDLPDQLPRSRAEHCRFRQFDRIHHLVSDVAHRDEHHRFQDALHLHEHESGFCGHHM